MLHKYAFAALVLLLATSGAQAQDAPAPTDLAAVPAGMTAGPASAEDEVLEQTRRGELDFTKMLASKKQNMFLHEGHMYTKPQYALVLWALRAKSLGIASAERACAVYAAATKRALTAAEKQAIGNAFESSAQE